MNAAEYTERVEKGDRVGWVYFVEAGSEGPIKIGWAKDPVKRMNVLQTAQPVLLNLIGVIPGTKYLESDIHRRLRYHRHVGEWFERKAALKLAKPVIASHGIFLFPEVPESRKIPGMEKRGLVPKPNYMLRIQEVK